MAAPQFFSDAYFALIALFADTRGGWDGLPILTHLAIGVALAGVGVYVGSKAETTAWSAVLFFAAFACFAYVIAQGMNLLG